MCEEVSRESFIWRPVIAKIISVQELKTGVVTLVDLVKINALLDMKADIEYKMSKGKGDI